MRLVDGAEYKRRQMPPGVRITTKAFGKDRRMPITNHYRAPVRQGPPGGAMTVEMSPGPGGPARTAVLLDQAAHLVGAYRWIEQRLFELTGRLGVRRAGAGRGRST